VSTRFDQIADDVKTLPPDQQRQLRDLLDRLLADRTSPTPEELLERRLCAPGGMKPGRDTPDVRKQRLRRWIESNRDLSGLPEEAFRRESFYDEWRRSTGR
jgi:hypothetical protein